MKIATLWAALLLVASPTWAINKCKGPDGKVVYQNHPCENAERVNLSGAGQGDQNSSGATYWKREVARQARSDRGGTAIANGQVFVGMTAEEVEISWGSPSKINASVGSYGRHEQWVYRRGNASSQYVYVQNGIVTSIQSPE